MIEDVMKAVYCYYFPEVRKVMEEVAAAVLPEMFLVRTPAPTVTKALSGVFAKPLEITQTADGAIDLDRLHEPIIERILKVYATQAPDITKFAWRYPTSGSSEGIFHILAGLRARGVLTIYTLAGEYEGFAAQAKNLCMSVRAIDPTTTDVSQLAPGYWFISNPSARDGDIITNDFITQLCNVGHRLLLDLTYVGSTKPHSFDLSHPNIRYVVMSLSKSFGLFRFRIGFTLSREEIPSLYGNRWFKDITRFLQALKVVETFGLTALYEKYRPLQLRIVDELRRRTGLPFHGSDSILLARLSWEEAATLSQQQKDEIAQYLRHNTYRFCLTPCFERLESFRTKVVEIGVGLKIANNDVEQSSSALLSL